jgi:cysteate synthase
MGNFDLVCLECGRERHDLSLRCAAGCNSFLRTRYTEKAFRPAPERSIFKFSAWLPCQGRAATDIGPIVYRSEELARSLGLERLYCAFNGYWPERGAGNATGTFKDFEALPSILSLQESGKSRIILASAGNTARAFAHAARLVSGFTVYLVVPEKMLDRIWLPGEDAGKDNVRLVALAGSSDYSAAIRLSDEIAKRFDIDPEGGARNVARRDGMGTVMLEAGRVLGRLPDHYFQAVGSGTGGIAAYEAALRLQGDAAFQGQELPRLHLSQNAPFLPIYQAWKNGDGAPVAWPAQPQADREPLFASVLANRTPPYSIRGGVADALTACRGEVYAVSNEEALEAAGLFARLEGIDLEPAAAVAVASLRQAITSGGVRREDLILLNLTGGGFDLIRRDLGCRPVAPDLVLDESSLGSFESIL